MVSCLALPVVIIKSTPPKIPSWRFEPGVQFARRTEEKIARDEGGLRGRDCFEDLRVERDRILIGGVRIERHLRERERRLQLAVIFQYARPRDELFASA